MTEGVISRRAMWGNILILSAYVKMKQFLAVKERTLQKNSITVFLGKKHLSSLQMMLLAQQSLNKKQLVFSKNSFLISKDRKFGLSFFKIN